MSLKWDYKNLIVVGIMASESLALFLIASLIQSTVSTDCPDAWVAFQGSCYLFGHQEKASFVEAEHFCSQHHNSHLVHIETKVENLFVKDFVRPFEDNDADYWIGMKDDVVDGIWKWSGTDDISNFFDWNPSTSEPSGGTNEDCAALVARFDGRWIDTTCSSQYEPICELRSDAGEFVG